MKKEWFCAVAAFSCLFLASEVNASKIGDYVKKHGVPEPFRRKGDKKVEKPNLRSNLPPKIHKNMNIWGEDGSAVSQASDRADEKLSSSTIYDDDDSASVSSRGSNFSRSSNKNDTSKQIARNNKQNSTTTNEKHELEEKEIRSARSLEQLKTENEALKKENEELSKWLKITERELTPKVETQLAELNRKDKVIRQLETDNMQLNQEIDKQRKQYKAMAADLEQELEQKASEVIDKLKKKGSQKN